MDNIDLAVIFDQIANILEIKDENPFRIRSYRRVAEALKNAGFDVARAALDDPDRVRSIPGIGEATFRKILELVQTGDCQEHSRLLSEVPGSLLTLLELQNLGPRKIAVLWKELGITTLDQLEEAARRQQLRTLSGFGGKSEAKILEAVRSHRGRAGRIRLDRAIAIADNLIQHLQKNAKIQRIAAAGSVRRRRETIGDIDILTSGEDPQGIIDLFVNHDTAEEVIVRGDTKASIRNRQGHQIDLRVLEDASFGSALQYFTGSKQHNVALRERAKRLGYKISEYGLFELATDKSVAGTEEDDIYRLLGLGFIPPEIREDTGELELAETGQLPQLIEQEDLRGDLHMHTTDSDGKNSLEEMVAAARERGFEFIAITDHSKALAMTGGLNEAQLREQMEAIQKHRATNPGIEVLTGIEVDILADGSLDLEDDVLEDVDVVIASVHSRFNLTTREMTTRICKALEHPAVNILAHPTGRLVLRRDAYTVDLEEIFRTAAENRVCMEINAYPARLDLSDTHSRMARDMGVLLSVNSDAHSTSMFDYLSYGIDTARRGWLAADDVINTFSLNRLRRVLEKKEYRS